jgi:hypothetical protein
MGITPYQERACVFLNWSKMVFIRFYDLETVLDFAFVPESLAATSLLEPAEVCRTELKPFLTIFGTSMRARSKRIALALILSKLTLWKKRVLVHHVGQQTSVSYMLLGSSSLSSSS